MTVLLQAVSLQVRNKNMEDRKKQLTEQPPNYPKRMHASHSFSHTPSAPQLIIYATIVAEMVVYFTCLWSVYKDYVIMGFYSATGLIMLIFGVVCSFSNPTDLIVYHYKWSKMDKSIKFDNNFAQFYYCEYCESFCHVKSKHCRVCNRCVSNFDHHCIWINNCVGSANYISFFLLIIITCGHFMLFIVSGALMSWQQHQPAKNETYHLRYQIPVWVIMVLLSVYQIFLIQLIGLHIYLKIRGISTYDFLQQRRRQEKEQKNQQKNQILSPDKITEQETSNAKININYVEPEKIQVRKRQEQNKKPVEKKTKRKNLSKDRRIKTHAQVIHVQNLDLAQEDIEQMPQFLKKNSSLKMIFGSAEVLAPMPSRKLVRIE